MKLTELKTQLETQFTSHLQEVIVDRDQLIIEVAPENLKSIMKVLRDDDKFKFDMLIDVSGVDYLEYGKAEWQTESTTATGFDRGVDRENKLTVKEWKKPRFASTCQLLSLDHSHRLRVRTFVPEGTMTVPTLVDLWPAANWYERESYDLFGILYEGHPDLRRILTDYGFVGHPFRKDFPMSGNVEVHYDAEKERVVYAPVEIEPRILVPKVIRDDSRYIAEEKNSNE